MADINDTSAMPTKIKKSPIKEILEYILKDMASVFTTRATMYRERAGFDHFSVKLSVGVQEMAGGIKGVKASGVMFTEDPDSGNPNVVVIRGTWGLGELIVQGVEKGDEFIVFKHDPRQLRIIRHELVKKEKMMIFSNGGAQIGTEVVPVPEDLQMKYCLTEEEVLILAEFAQKIRKHYNRRMDIEWAVGNNGRVYIVQARPETVHSQKGGGWPFGTILAQRKRLDSGAGRHESKRQRPHLNSTRAPGPQEVQSLVSQAVRDLPNSSARPSSATHFKN